MPSTLIFSFAVLLILPAAARIFNVTIDDTLGDSRTGQKPRYEPPNWIPRSVGGAPCQGCTAQPDASYASNGTWHDKTTFANDASASLSIDFNGTQIYVYCILPNGIWNTINTTRLDFRLDGSSTPVRRFLHEKDEALPPYLYNQLVFRSDRLPAGSHTLLVSNMPGETGSLILFDYAIYTTEDPDDSETATISSPVAPASPAPAPPRTTPSSKAVVGGAVSGALLGTALVILAVAYCVYWRRRAPASSSLAGWDGPFGHPPDARFARLQDNPSDLGRAGPSTSNWYSHCPER